MLTYWGELEVHRTQVHVMINRIMPRYLACLMCRLEGRSFCGTEYEMAFHLINTHPNVQTWMPLPRLVTLVMEEVVSPPPQMWSRVS